MAPESCRESEEVQGHPAPEGGKQVSSDLGPLGGTPTDTMAPSCPQNTKPHSTPAVFSVNPQLAPESLDPRTLRLLWEQREMELQALRWTIHSGQHVRHCHILQEVAGIPPERSYYSQNRLLQNQVQKLTLELRAQKEQAQLERERLQERLVQTQHTLQQLEAELQAFQQSCLLQLARSSWVGRLLRSQTGSVEVVTVETLMDPEDLSENNQAPAPGEGFRLEDVDWNSIAHRYPNLFTSIHSISEQKPPPPLDTWSSGSPSVHLERPGKSLEWSSLPWISTSTSGGITSDSGSHQLVLHPEVQKVIGRPPQAADLASSEQIQAQSSRVGGDVEGPGRADSQPLSKTVVEPSTEPGAEPGHQDSGHQLSLADCCLKIAAVSARDKFVRIVNQSPSAPVDLDGFVLQQLLQDAPARVYRFPPGTLLAPGHHVTVWGAGAGGARQQPSASSGRGCVTRLLSRQGQVLSEHQTPHCVTLGSKIFDNTDWSIDRFPLPEAGRGASADPGGERPRRPLTPRKGRARKPAARRRTPGWAPSETRPQAVARAPRLLPDRRPAPASPLPQGPGLGPSRPPRSPRARGTPPLPSTRKPARPGEGPARPDSFPTEARELLPAIPGAELCLEDRPARKEPRVRVCRKAVDRSCPMVALSVQSTAESRYGFRFLSCPPITADTCRRV